MLSPYMSPVERLWFYSLRILCGLVLLFLVLPVLVIVPLSFNSGTFLVYPLQGFSLRWYADFFQSAEWMRSLTNSMIVAPAATLLAMVFGTLAGQGPRLLQQLHPGARAPASVLRDRHDRRSQLSPRSPGGQRRPQERHGLREPA